MLLKKEVSNTVESQKDKRRTTKYLKLLALHKKKTTTVFQKHQQTGHDWEDMASDKDGEEDRNSWMAQLQRFEGKQQLIRNREDRVRWRETTSYAYRHITI